jgi:UDP-N-acetylmuramoylalanine-D-glutamate ligase
VLLSPGGTSFDAFKDFAERGDRFIEVVNGLPR